MPKLDTQISARPRPADPTPKTSVSSPSSRTTERSEFRENARLWSPPLEAVKARWTWVAAGAVVTSLLAFLAPTSGQSTATAVMQMTKGDMDSLRVKQLGQTVERTVMSEAVLAAAANARGLQEGDLVRRVVATWEVDTDLVTVTVTSADAQAAVKDANAVAEAVVRVGEQQARERLTQIQEESNDLLTSGSLSDREAEAARRTQLGASVAGRQDAASSSATSVVLLDPAVEASPTGLSRSLRLLLGLVSGALLAAGAAIGVPMARRRARSIREVAALSPGLRVTAAGDAVGDLAGRLVESDRTDLAIVALPDLWEDASEFAQEVARMVRDHGASVAVVTGADQEDGERILSRAGRSRTRRDQGADVLITVVPDEDWALRLLRGQSGLHTVVLAGRGDTPLGGIWRSTAALELANPTVVIAR